MDLFAPCRSCLQCLPFFHVSPASPRRLTTASPISSLDQSKPAPADSPQSSDGFTCSSAAPSLQEQDPYLPIVAEETPQAASHDKDGAFEPTITESEASHDKDDAFELTETASEALPVSGIVIAPPVSSPCSGAPFLEAAENGKSTTLPELPLEVPFINDITFPGTGFLPLQSPITPAPIGAGYSAGKYHPQNQIYQDGLAQLHHGHENEQLDHEHSLHGHESSHHSHHRYDHLHHGNAHSHDGDQELQNYASHHHSHPHAHDSSIANDADNSVTGCTSPDVDHHGKVEDIPLTASLGPSQSTPELDLDANVAGSDSAATDTNGTSALLETYHSEPVVLSEELQNDANEPQNEVLGFSMPLAARRPGRRDQFRAQFKGIKQQLKQGGHHIKEEGSKHMQNIIENMNKQAQQLEQSGRFFNVPRANNN